MKRTQAVRSNRRRAVGAMSAVAAAALFAACGGDSPPTQPASMARDGNTVVMKLIAFKPEKTTVQAGTAVTWRQSDPGVHTVTSGLVQQEGGGVSTKPDGLFDSGQIATGKSFTFTFADPGTFAYFCAVHPATMRGEVTVT